MSKIYPIGRVYAIRSPNIDEIYIGSTFNPLYKRFGEHKGNLNHFKKGKGNYTASFKILEQGNAYIELIEQYENLTKEQLNKYEGEHIRKNACVNKYVAGRSTKQWQDENKNRMDLKSAKWRNENKEKLIENFKKYIDVNKDKIKDKHICECGGKYTILNKSHHLKTKKHQDFMYPK